MDKYNPTIGWCVVSISLRVRFCLCIILNKKSNWPSNVFPVACARALMASSCTLWHVVVWSNISAFVPYFSLNIVEETYFTGKLKRQRAVVAITRGDAALHRLPFCLRDIWRFDALCRDCQPCLVIHLTVDRPSRYLNRTQLRRKRTRLRSRFFFFDKAQPWLPVLRLFISRFYSPVFTGLRNTVQFLSFCKRLIRSLRHAVWACSVLRRTCLQNMAVITSDLASHKGL